MSDQPKKGFGCCFWGCLFFFAVGVVMVGALFYGASQIYGTMYALTSPTAVTIPEVVPDKTEFGNIMAKVEKFKAGGDADTELRLTPDEMNQIVANIPELKGKLNFSIKDKVLQIRGCLPLDDYLKGSMFQSYFEKRFITGKAGIKFIKDRGFVSFELVSFESQEGKLVDASTLAAVNATHWGESLAKQREIGPAIHELKDIRVEDDAVIISRRAAAVQPETTSGSGTGSGTETTTPSSGSSSDGNSSSSSSEEKGGGLKSAH